MMVKKDNKMLKNNSGKTKIVLSIFLTVVILTSSLYLIFNNETSSIRIDIEKTRTKYSVWEDNSYTEKIFNGTKVIIVSNLTPIYENVTVCNNSNCTIYEQVVNYTEEFYNKTIDTWREVYVKDEGFVLAATEYVRLWDGTTKMRAAINGRELIYWNDSENAYVQRKVKWKDNISTIQTYTFDKDAENIEDLPIENKLECINCEGKIIEFFIKDILYEGETQKINSPFSFGHNMEIEWKENDDLYFSKVYQQKVASDKIIIRYKADESYEEYFVRLYDPDPWLFPDRINRKSINFTEAIVKNDSILINVTHNNNMQPDFRDLAFGNNSNTGTLGHWFYNNTVLNNNSALTWVFIDSDLSIGDEIWMYYNNATVTSTSNISNAFILGDDFLGSDVDWTKWQSTSQASYTVSGGILSFTTPGVGSSGFMTTNYSHTNFTSELRIRNVAGSDGPYYLFSDYTWNSNTATEITFRPEGLNIRTSINGGIYTGANWVQNTWYRGINNIPTGGPEGCVIAQSDIRVNLSFECGTITNDDNLYPHLLSWTGTTGQVDWVYIKKYRENATGLETFGEEESLIVQNPYFTVIPDNVTINYTQGFGVDFDGENVDTYFLGNWTDIFQINQSGWLENSSSNLAVGNYQINVSINNSENTINSTIYQVTVNKAVPSGSISGTSPIEYPLAGDVEGTESNPGDGGCSYNLLRDLISVSNPDITILSAGTFNYIYNTSGCVNWTSNASLDTFELIVNQNTSLTLGLTGTTPVEYPATTDFTGSNCPSQLTCTLNLTNQEFTAGVINANYSTSGNTNFSATSSVFAITINKNSSTTLGITGTTPITYGTTTDVVGSDCPSQLTCTLDKTNKVYSAGSQLFNYSTPGNANYSATSSVINITINKDTPIGSLTTSLGWIINESQEITIGYTESQTNDGDVTYLVYRDNVSKGSGETWNPAYGIYNYVLNTTGGQNWTENVSMDVQTLTVNDITYPLLEILFPTNNSNFANPTITINVSVIENNVDTLLWSNDSYTTNHTFTQGDNITEIWEQGKNDIDVWVNDSAGFENRTSVSFFIDSINPIMTLIIPADHENFAFNTSIPLNYSAVDTNLANCWYHLDNGINVTLPNCLNGTFNTSEGSHNITLYGNDTFGNLGSDTNEFTISLTAPAITLDTPEEYAEINYNLNIDFNFTATDINGIDTCELWSNWSSGWHLNETFTSITSGVQVFTEKNISDGNYFWNVWCNDTVGDGRFHENNHSFEIDNTNPLVGVILPLNQTYVVSTVEFKINATDTNLDYCNMSLDSSENITMSQQGINWTYTNTTMTEGAHSVQYYCFDTFGNVNDSEIVNFGVDLNNPEITIISPEDSVAVNWNYTIVNYEIESNEGLKGCNVSIDDWSTNYTMNENTATNFSITINTTRGSNTARFECIDLADRINITSKDFTVRTVVDLGTGGNANLNGDINVDYVFVAVGATITSRSSPIPYLNLTVAENITIMGVIVAYGFTSHLGTSQGVGQNGQADYGGGGGAGHYGAGGAGGTADGAGGAGGATYGYDTSNTNITEGSYGGIGNSGGYNGNGGAGIRLYSPTIIIGGTINTYASGASYGGFGEGGGGGGGAGGSILIKGNKLYLNNSNLRAYGGTGGAGGTTRGGGGGGGGGGYVKIFWDRVFENNSMTINVVGGAGGSGTGGDANGASGNSGKYYSERETFYSLVMNNPIENEFVNNPILFNCTTVETGFLNISLFIDGTHNITVYNTTTDELMNLTSYLNLSDGAHSYYCRGFDGIEEITLEPFSFTADSTAPNITYISPIDNYISEFINNTLTTTVNDSLSNIKNVSLFTDISGWSIKQTNTTVNESNNYTVYFNISISEETIYAIKVCDTLGNCRLGDNRTIFLDLFPSIVNIIYPNELNYIINITEINYTATDDYPGVCWYEKNGANSSSVSYGTNFTDVNSQIGNNTIKVYCNDSRNNLGNDTFSYWLDVIEYVSSSDPTNKFGTFPTDIFVNVTINPVFDLSNITYVLYNESGLYNETVYSSDTNLTWESLPSGIYYWNVTTCNTSSSCYTTPTRYYGVEVITLRLNNETNNLTLELGTQINVNATSNIENVIVDVLSPEYGVNYSIGYKNNTFDLIINYFRSNLFLNGILETITIPFINTTTINTANFYIPVHQYDEVIGLAFNISGLTTGSQFGFVKSDNSSAWDRLYIGQLINELIYIYQTFDTSTGINELKENRTLAYDNKGEQLIYFFIDDNSDLNNFTFYVEGQEYGFNFTDTEFITYRDNIFSTALIRLGRIVPYLYNYAEFIIDDFADSSINTTIWLADSTGSGESGNYDWSKSISEGSNKITLSSSIEEQVPNNEEGEITLENYIRLNPSELFFLNINETEFGLSYSITGNQYDDADACDDTYARVYVADSILWYSYLENCQDEGGGYCLSTSQSVGNLTFTISNHNETSLKFQVNGTDVLQGEEIVCGIISTYRYWDNGTTNTIKDNCDNVAGALTNPTYFTPDITNDPIKIGSYINGDYEDTFLDNGCTGSGLIYLDLDEVCYYDSVILCSNQYTESDCENPLCGFYSGSCTWEEDVDYEEGCESSSASMSINYINKTIGKMNNGSYVSTSVFDSAVDISTITMQMTRYGAVNNYISTDDGDNYQNILLDTSTPITSPGQHVKWATVFVTNDIYCSSNTCFPFISLIDLQTPKGYPHNITFDFGNDGVNDYSLSGILNTSVKIDLSDIDMSSFPVFDGVAEYGDHLYLVPLSVTSASSGIIYLDNFSLWYNPNPISLNLTSIRNSILNLSGKDNLNLTIAAINGTINLTDLKYDFAGGNQTIEIKAHNTEYSINVSRYLNIFYSRWDYFWGPEGVEWLFFSPRTPTSKNVTPYGQSDNVPILYITNYGYGDANVTLSILQNESVECVNRTMSITNQKSDGILLNQSFQTLTNLTYLENTSIYLWTDYSCNYSTWRTTDYYFYFRPVCQGCLASEDLD